MYVGLNNEDVQSSIVYFNERLEIKYLQWGID